MYSFSQPCTARPRPSQNGNLPSNHAYRKNPRLTKVTERSSEIIVGFVPDRKSSQSDRCHFRPPIQISIMDVLSRALSTIRSLLSTWAGYTACAWMVVFALISFYWAVGGTAGLATTAVGQELAGNSWFIIALWLTGILKLGGALFALALVQSWGQRIPRLLLLVPAWGTGALLVFHGGDFVVQGALTETGLISLSSPDGWTQAHWQTFVWGPWWLLGGFLFCVAAWNYQRRSRTQRAQTP